MKSYGTAVLVLLIAFVVSACGGADAPPKASRSTDQPEITGEPAGFNGEDLTFANAMVTLYGQTTELTDLVPGRTTNPNLVALAADIVAAQGPDLQTVKVFLVQWNSNSDTGSSEVGPGNTVPGMVDDATMALLKSLSGAEFDALWLQSMIRHQQGIVDMAKVEIADGANVDATTTARQFVGTYQAQIARMQQMLAGR